MKRFNRFALSTLAIVLSTMVFSSACSRAGGDPAKLIDSDAQMVVIAPNLGNTINNISGFIDWLSTKSPMAGIAKKQIPLTAGFDIFNPEELEKRGFHPDGGFAIVVENVANQQAYGILSIKNKKAFIKFLNETFSKQGMPEMKEEDGYYNGPFGAMTFRKGFALFGKSQSVLEKVGEGDSLKGSDAYKMALEHTGDNNDILVYISPEFITASSKMGLAGNPEADALEKAMEIYGAMCLGLKLSGSDIEAKSFVQMLDMSKVKSIMNSVGGSDMLAKMPGKPAIMGRTQLNFPALWTYIRELAESDPQANTDISQTVMEMNRVMEMDVEKEIIPAIAGDAAFTYYGMTGRRKDTPDIMAALSLKDPGKIRDAMDKLVELGMVANPKRGSLKDSGAVEFRADQNTKFYFAVDGKQLLIATSDKRMKTMLDGAVNESAMDDVPHADAKKLLEDITKNVVYMNAARMVESIKAGMRKSEARELDSNLEMVGGVGDAYLLMQADVIEEGVTGSVKFHMGQ